MSVLVTGDADAVTEEDVVELFKNVQMVVGFMRGSHHSMDTVGTALTFEGLEEEGTSPIVYDDLAAIPYLMDGPSAKILMGFPVNAPLSAGKDMFKGQPWVEKMNEVSRRMSEFILNCGGFPAFRVFGHATEYTTLPETQGAIKKLKWEQPAGNALEAQVLKSILGMQSSGIAKKISNAVIAKAKDSNNPQVIPISLKVLMSDPSLILALQSFNEQINRNAGVFGSSAYIESNAYVTLLIADVPGVKTAADVEKVFAAAARGTNNGARASKDMFAAIVSQEDMQEGDISNPADLIKQLQRMGIALESLQGFVGPKEWVAAMKKQPGVSDKAVEGNVDAKGNTIAFTGNALFAVVEAIASPERTLSPDIQQALDVVMEATSIAVTSNEINPKITDSIESYRNQVEAIVRI